LREVFGPEQNLEDILMNGVCIEVSCELKNITKTKKKATQMMSLDIFYKVFDYLRFSVICLEIIEGEK
jgi:hypothetical protein